MTLSIIVPLYNAAATARRCVDSALAQTVRDFELILVDDGSSDATPAICDDYARLDSRVRVIHQANAGVSTARNAGLDICSGEWVTFLDADDHIEPRFAEAIDAPAYQGADWVLVGWKHSWDDKAPNKDISWTDGALYQGWPQIKPFWNSMADREVCRCPWTKFFRRSLIEQHGLRFDVTLRYGEDTLFNYQYLTHVQTIALRDFEQGRYIYHLTSGTSAIRKYKSTPESLISARDQIFTVFFERGLTNIRFERLFFFAFPMIEHCFAGQPDAPLRRDYYHSPIQARLEQDCLGSVKWYDRWMYLVFKYLPHSLVRPLARLYLRFR